MARRYDGRTNIFSPEGRLYQVEYAMEAISNAGSAIGILSREGVVLAAEKKISSKLLDATSKSDKMYHIDQHVGCAVAGITSDANILIEYARLASQRYSFRYGEPIPVEQLVRVLCDHKQSYTQFGGLRPFGVSYLFAGWDRHFQFQLYQSDPSGNYAGWKATAIGAHNQTAQGTMKQEFNPDCTLDEALKLAIKVISKTVDRSAFTSEKLEFSTLTLKDGKPFFRFLTQAEIDSLIETVDLSKSETTD